MLFWSTAYYRFYRSGISDNPVSAVYAVCGNNNFCILNSTVTSTELPIATTNNPLPSSSNCVVNFVEIIHDCMPRRVDLDLSFTSHATDKLYLEVRNDS